MKALLILPDSRPEVQFLSRDIPLAITHALGQTLIEYWLEHLASLGVKNAIILAADRPQIVRSVVGEGERWGMDVQVITRPGELTIEQARALYVNSSEEWVSQPYDVTLVDRLPNQLHPLFTSYRDYFSAIWHWIPKAKSPATVGYREIKPGIWVGLRTRISPRAKLFAPCWIGHDAIIEDGSEIGPGAIVGNDVIVETHAHITNSVVGPYTFVGRFTFVSESIASGSELLNWKTNSYLEVPDAFLLSSLGRHPRRWRPTKYFGRVLAVLAMALTWPLALIAIARCGFRPSAAFRRCLAVVPGAPRSDTKRETISYCELVSAPGWLRRWPQLWSIARGDFFWVGNRPLTPNESKLLTSDFERLWLATPIGLISLADVEGCGNWVTPEACAHSSYFATQRSPKIIVSILCRAFFRGVILGQINWTVPEPRSAPFPSPILKHQG